MSRRHYINDAPVTTLSASLTNIATTCQVTTATGFPGSFPWTAVIDPGTASAEVVLVTGAVGTTLTITRGYDGTSAQAHNNAATFAHEAVQMDYDEANSHVNSSTGVHGLAGAVVGTTDVQTLSGKTLTSPTINTPTITAPTVTGGATVSGGLTSSAGVTTAKAAAAGVAFQTEKSDGTVKLTVDGDTGNVSTPGTLASGAHTVTGGVTASGTVQGATVTSTGAVNAASAAISGNETVGGTLAVTGASTAASYTATGNVAGLELLGAVVPATYTNQGAVATALGTVPANTIVYLSAPTGPGNIAGLYLYDGTGFNPLIPTNAASWVSYTPTLTNLTLGNGTLNAFYSQNLKKVTVWWTLNAGTTTTYNSSGVSIGLPTTAVTGSGEQGGGLKVYTGSLNYPAWAVIPDGASSATILITLPSGGDGRLTNMSGSAGVPNPGTTGNLVGSFTYRSA